MRTALLRADGSKHLGLGHIMRGIALAQGFEEIGIKPIFVIRDYDSLVAQQVNKHGYTVETFPKDWGFTEDLALMRRLIGHYHPRMVVTDLCNVDTLRKLDDYLVYLKGLKHTGVFLVTIDDLNVIPFPSDIVINPNYGAEELLYGHSGSTRYLLGPKYFIFRDEFIQAAKVERKIRKEAHNILVTMGGSDQLELTKRVIQALTQLDAYPPLDLRVIIGIDDADIRKEKLLALLEDLRGSYKLLSRTDSMAELMLWADLAITGGGLTKYEAAVTGTPSIILSQVDHQHTLMVKFSKAGTAQYLGPGGEITKEGIAERVHSLLKDYSLRLEMSRRGKTLVDDRGVERILAAISEEVLVP